MRTRKTGLCCSSVALKMCRFLEAHKLPSLSFAPQNMSL
uniref:Uncharacterized protein n=1 Tax=Anguilla anguilla TaxID=7936 RepID=A0A0E9RJU5_ANGAN